MFAFSAFRSTFLSCENLHLLPEKGEFRFQHSVIIAGDKETVMDLPFSQIPALKKAHMIVFGSTPNGTFG